MCVCVREKNVATIVITVPPEGIESAENVGYLLSTLVGLALSTLRQFGCHFTARAILDERCPCPLECGHRTLYQGFAE